MVNFKGAHFEKDVILTCVRWYVAYPFSYCQLKELMPERGVSVDRSTIHRWVLKRARRHGTGTGSIAVGLSDMAAPPNAGFDGL
jgi:transposase-like protein